MAHDYFRVKNGFSMNDEVNLLYGSINPISSGLTAPIGSIFCNKLSGAIYHKTGAGDYDWKLLLDTAGASTEDTYQNTFMGKNSTGDELPDYSSTNHVADDDSLETAIGKLDDEIGAAISSPEPRTNNPISDQDVNDNISQLDKTIGDDYDHTSTNHTTLDDPINAKISDLDAALSEQLFKKSETNVPTPTNYVMDTIPWSNYTMFEWMVNIVSNSTATNRQGQKIVAINDSGNVDYTTYSILTLGGGVSGLSIDVVDDGPNTKLRISASENINYSLVRIAIA